MKRNYVAKCHIITGCWFITSTR